MPAQSPSFIARGDIPSSVFVKQDTASDHGIVIADADDEAVGISHEGTREVPITGITPLAAIDGESCQVYTDTWTCEVVAGDDITAGDKLKPDANGHAIPAGAGDIYSAIARAAASDTERCKVTVTRGQIPA